MWHSWLSIGTRLEQPSQHSPGFTESTQLPTPTWSEPSVSASAPFRYAVEPRKSLIGWHFVSVAKDNRIKEYYYVMSPLYSIAKYNTNVCDELGDGCLWGSLMKPHTYPGQRCLRRLPEEGLCRAGTHSVPHPIVTHWTEKPAVHCQRNSPAGTGCPSKLWGYMWDRDSEDTEYRDTDVRHVVRKEEGVRMKDWMERDKGDERGEWDMERGEKGAREPFVGFLFNWVKEKWASKWFIQVDL